MRFLRRDLQARQWTHHAHLVVGLWHALDRPATQIPDELRQGIIGHNAAVGTAEMDSGGCHETITAFYVWAIRKYLRRAEPGRTPLELINGLFAGRYARKSFPFEHYRCERLPSVPARRGWVAPDPKPLT